MSDEDEETDYYSSSDESIDFLTRDLVVQDINVEGNTFGIIKVKEYECPVCFERKTYSKVISGTKNLCTVCKVDTCKNCFEKRILPDRKEFKCYFCRKVYRIKREILGKTVPHFRPKIKINDDSDSDDEKPVKKNS